MDKCYYDKLYEAALKQLEEAYLEYLSCNSKIRTEQWLVEQLAHTQVNMMLLEDRLDAVEKEIGEEPESIARKKSY